MKKIVLISFLIAVIISDGTAYAKVKLSPPASIETPNTIEATGTIEVGFSPNGGITEMIVQEIDSAQSTIEVQGYSFTSVRIAKALVDAHKRGVTVRIILDKSQKTEKYSAATFVSNAGIPVHTDAAFAIAHSKIMIIDGKDVITGSFNFTKAAEQNNAENCLILRGNKALVDLYVKNWLWRWNATQ